jgi:hypothetical protein
MLMLPAEGVLVESDTDLCMDTHITDTKTNVTCQKFGFPCKVQQ